MLLPKGQSHTPETAEEQPPDPALLESRLEAVLSKIEGAGDTEVLLTLETGVHYEYQTNDKTHSQTEETETQRETVLVSDGDKEMPLTVKTTYPTYLGALILCEGADSASVRLDIVHAVSNVTGLGADKISVIKMQDN